VKDRKKIEGWSAQIRINGIETFITVQAGDCQDATMAIKKALSLKKESLLRVHETEMAPKG